jgi:protein TonB
MAKVNEKAPGFDEIVFEKRNKEYGAYVMRKKYPRTILISMIIGMVILTTAILTPYLNAVRVQVEGNVVEERVVEVVMENLDTPTEVVAPPPPPPEAPTETVVQAKYVPPVVVDSVAPEDEAQFMTADEISTVVVDEAVEDITVVEVAAEEIMEEEAEPEPFVVVEEMPFYPGGNEALLKYVFSNIVYPEIARENNVQGRVFIRFCVTATGAIGQVEVMRGVDPDLDAEAVRVIRTIKGFQPGKQGGQPVPVWYQLPINFQLQN